MRKSHEDVEALTREELAGELAAMNRLHELCARLYAQKSLQSLLGEVLDASIILLNADFGDIQLYDAETGTLQIVAQRGFAQEFLDYFRSVREGTTACGMALERRERVIAEDVLSEPF